MSGVYLIDYRKLINWLVAYNKQYCYFTLVKFSYLQVRKLILKSGMFVYSLSSHQIENGHL